MVIAGFLVPMLFGGTTAVYSACVLIVIFAVMAYGLDIIVSDLGEVSLAHTVFFATGAYTTALVSTNPDMGPIITLICSTIMALLAAAALGLVTIRLREFAFSLVTYAVAVIVTTIAENAAFLAGSDGLRGIPIFTLSFGSLSYSAGTDRQLWPVAYLLLMATLWLVHAFRRSRLGHAAMMVNLNARLATMSGINPQRTRLLVFLFSAPITSAAGWLYAYQRAYVSADVLEFYFLILMLTAVVLVGRQVMLGPLIGVLLIQLQEKFLSFGANVDKIVLGAGLILVMTCFRGGLVGATQSLRKAITTCRTQRSRPVTTARDWPPLQK